MVNGAAKTTRGGGVVLLVALQWTEPCESSLRGILLQGPLEDGLHRILAAASPSVRYDGPKTYLLTPEHIPVNVAEGISVSRYISPSLIKTRNETQTNREYGEVYTGNIMYIL